MMKGAVLNPTSLRDLAHNTLLNFNYSIRNGHLSLNKMVEDCRRLVEEKDNKYTAFKFSMLLLCSTLLSVLIVATRRRLIRWMTKSKAIDPVLATKIAETSVKNGTLIILYPFITYFVFSRSEVLYDPITALRDYHITKEIPPFSVSLLYMLRLSYCVSSCFLSIFTDTKRSDFGILMVHHVCTFILIYFSDLVRLNFLGLVILFLHDITDILLGLVKTCSYCIKIESPWRGLIILTQIIFYIIFMTMWVTFRNIVFPINILRYYNVAVVNNWPPFLYSCTHFICFFLVVLATLNFYWLTLIVKNFFKIIGKQYDDVRE